MWREAGQNPYYWVPWLQKQLPHFFDDVNKAGRVRKGSNTHWDRHSCQQIRVTGWQYKEKGDVMHWPFTDWQAKRSVDTMKQMRAIWENKGLERCHCAAEIGPFKIYVDRFFVRFLSTIYQKKEIIIKVCSRLILKAILKTSVKKKWNVSL